MKQVRRSDVETWIKSMQFVTSYPGVRFESELMATLGGRILLQRLSWIGESHEAEFLTDKLRLIEVAADPNNPTMHRFPGVTGPEGETIVPAPVPADLPCERTPRAPPPARCPSRDFTRRRGAALQPRCDLAHYGDGTGGTIMRLGDEVRPHDGRPRQPLRFGGACEFVHRLDTNVIGRPDAPVQQVLQ